MSEPHPLVRPARALTVAVVIVLFFGILAAGARSFAAPAAISGLIAVDGGTETPVEPTASPTATPAEMPTETPVLADPTECTSDPSATSTTAAEPSVVATAENATPVAIEEPTQPPDSAICPESTEEPEAVIPTEAAAVTPGAAEPTPGATATAETSLTPTPDAATGPASEDPSLVGIPTPPAEAPALIGIPTPVFEDPALIGMPTPLAEAPTPSAAPDAPSMVTPVDPVLIDLDEVTATPVSKPGAPADTVVDPMLSGVSGAPIVTGEVSAGDDPAMVGLAPQTDAAAPLPGTTQDTSDSGPTLFRSHNKAVAVDLASSDGSVTPGGQISYQFTVTNVGKGRSNFQLEVLIDTVGWLASVSIPPEFIGANGRIQLDAGEVMIVTVTVVAPEDAVIGAVAVATLNVTDLR